MRIIDFKESKCMHCYKCVRYCDVKAVMIKDGRAEVIEDKCVLCGHCLHVCPQSAKTMASDLDTVKYYIRPVSYTHLEYDGEDGPIKINLLDTPGYFDFVGEVEEAVSVADAAIIVVNCKAGIEVGTEKAWELCEEYNLPRIIFVTNMDDDQASFRELILKPVSYTHLFHRLLLRTVTCVQSVQVIVTV